MDLVDTLQLDIILLLCCSILTHLWSGSQTYVLDHKSIFIKLIWIKLNLACW